MDSLDPIESYLRDEPPPSEAVLLLRGGPVTIQKLVEHAARQMRELTLRSLPMASISVDGTVGLWTREKLLRERLWSRSQYAVALVGRVQEAGFEVLPTHLAPHFDIVLAEASVAEAARLLAVFGAPEDNPFKRRRR